MPCAKVRHATKESAILTSKRVRNSILNVYHCKECKAWHLGSSSHPLRKMDRINQLLDNLK
jgi:hypothetical protein